MDAIQKEQIMAVVYRLMMYPIIMFFGFIFGSINRIQNAIEPENPSVALYCLATFFLNVNGFLNAIVYGLNVSIQNDIRKCLGWDEDEDEADQVGAGVPSVTLDEGTELSNVDLSSEGSGLQPASGLAASGNDVRL